MTIRKNLPLPAGTRLGPFRRDHLKSDEVSQVERDAYVSWKAGSVAPSNTVAVPADEEDAGSIKDQVQRYQAELLAESVAAAKVELCSQQQNVDEVPEISVDDKLTYLQALCSDQPFKKEYSLPGGKLAVTFDDKNIKNNPGEGLADVARVRTGDTVVFPPSKRLESFGETLEYLRTHVFQSHSRQQLIARWSAQFRELVNALECGAANPDFFDVTE